MKLQSIAGTISRRTWFLILGVVIALALVVHGIWPLSNRSTSHDDISVDLGHIADAGAAQDAGVIGSPEAGAPGVTWQGSSALDPERHHFHLVGPCDIYGKQKER